jgi:hypothetical protein
VYLDLRSGTGSHREPGGARANTESLRPDHPGGKGRLVGVFFQFRVRNGNPHVVAERLQVIQRQLLHLVGGVSTFEAGPKP